MPEILVTDTEYELIQEDDGSFTGHTYQLKFSGVRTFEQAVKHMLGKLHNHDRNTAANALLNCALPRYMAEQRRAKELQAALVAIRAATGLESMTSLIDDILQKSPAGRELLEQLFTCK